VKYSQLLDFTREWSNASRDARATDYYKCSFSSKTEIYLQSSTLNEIVQLRFIFLKEKGVQEQSEIPMKSLRPLYKHSQPKSEPQSLKLKDEGFHFLMVHQPR